MSVEVARPKPGDLLELSVDSLAFGGDGVARLEPGAGDALPKSEAEPDGPAGRGYVVFVAGALPGDRVRARVIKRKRGYAHARAVELLQPGPDRVPPLADHPGAPWQELSYERQLAVKSEQVEEALARIGGLRDFQLDDIVPAEQAWRYRNKLEYSFGTGPDGQLVCGFHAPGSWERIEPLEDCLLASEAGNEARAAVLAWCREQGLLAYDRATGAGFLRNLVVREGRRTGQIQVRLVTAPGSLDGESLAAAVPCDSLLWTRTGQLGETTQGGVTELVAGQDVLEEEVRGLRIRLSPDAFFQTNTEMTEHLYGAVAEMAALEGWERLFDLYCGVGTIGLTLARRAGELWGIEIVEQAVADAIANARLNEIDRAHFFAGDARLALGELVQRAGRPDVLVVDPPRAGLSQKIVRRVVEASPRRIVYVSCNPTTLAPNAAQLEAAGWRLRQVRPVDMFPQTPHIECVAVLERRR